VRRHGEPRAKLVLASPLVPLILVARIGRRAMRVPQKRSRFVFALPRLTALAIAWAAGEAAGALHDGRRAEVDR
jgi:hypothetical protein